jgi:hypothetical protein
MPFVADTEIVRFQENQCDRLLAHLERVNDQTMLSPISDPEDVLLLDTGETREGHRSLTSLALKQLCQHTAAGMSMLLYDIAGINRRRKDPESVSAATAVKVFNLVVALRFYAESGLYNRQMVIDTQRNVIDGVLGPNYKYLAHVDLIQATAESLEQLPHAVVFDSASLVGRHLTTVWRHLTPYFVIGGQLPIYGGYCVTNSEAGECSVSAALALMIGKLGTRCIKPLARTSRTAHAGKNFKRRLTGLLGNMLVASEQLAEQATQLQRLRQYPLQLATAKGVNQANRRRIIRRLSHEGMPPQIASEIVQLVTWAGATGSPAPEPSLRDAGERTLYDLFIRLCDRAAIYPYALREAMERAAFSLLLKPIEMRNE